MSAKKSLIAYYSHSGNTKNIALKIQQLTDSDLFEIKPVRAYPDNYNDIVNLAQAEKAKSFKPELIDNGNISDYDTIFVGTPVWWYTFSSPVRTFLSEHDFSGKTIIPFCTHGGGGESSTYTDMQKLCPSAIVKKGFTSFEDSAKLEDIEYWLK